MSTESGSILVPWPRCNRNQVGEVATSIPGSYHSYASSLELGTSGNGSRNGRPPADAGGALKRALSCSVVIPGCAEEEVLACSSQ